MSVQLAKRKRSESTSQPPLAEHELTRSKDLWFDDGNVVLQAEKTQFRVHRSVLSLHSSVFRDMFSAPLLHGDSTVDGCPLVIVQDTSMDWENILSVLYRGYQMYETVDDFPIDMLISMLRVGRKYALTHLVLSATRRLRAELPRTFRNWQESPLSDHKQHQPLRVADNVFTIGREVDLINAVSDAGLRSLLPTLFYLLLRDQDLSVVLEGAISESKPPSRLSLETQRAILVGRVGLMKGIMKYPVRWMISQGSWQEMDCEQDCAAERVAVLEESVQSFSNDVSWALQEIAPEVLERFCRKCAPRIKKTVSVAQSRLWDELPRYFGLPDWDTLIENEEKDLEYAKET
ncbi:hypothetical protein D9613_012381 [Agrocybe pediades]|uniref:BTB domain-containing protein n=1 Tax=Agrocybe pediades TaxID=84607 RepID=A0A8H4VN93_9AGAR|nr:hypothetical protein D9613_012381 [Agrocybe pediades]